MITKFKIFENRDDKHWYFIVTSYEWMIGECYEKIKKLDIQEYRFYLTNDNRYLILINIPNEMKHEMTYFKFYMSEINKNIEKIIEKSMEFDIEIFLDQIKYNI